MKIKNKTMYITAILAMDHSLLIWAKNTLPWHIPEDMRRFKELTLWGIVVMGKNTYLSLPDKVRPLPWRRNIVITREAIEWVECYSSIESFISRMSSEKNQKCYLIGGWSLYNQFFDKGIVDAVELTLVDGVHEWDIYVREFRSQFRKMSSDIFDQWQFISLIKE